MERPSSVSTAPNKPRREPRTPQQRLIIMLDELDTAAKALWSTCHFGEVCLSDELLAEVKREARRIERLMQKVRDAQETSSES